MKFALIWIIVASGNVATASLQFQNLDACLIAEDKIKKSVETLDREKNKSKMDIKSFCIDTQTGSSWSGLFMR